LEYSVDEVEVHIDAFNKIPSARVLLVDDLIATGGTANAAAKLISQAGASCVEACFIIALDFLEGQKELKKSTEVYSLVEVK
jgi:adenine phosphoribosyltransferase